jgi:hypothetical protein
MKKTDATQEKHSSLNLSADSLKGKQSVRATFRLPGQCIALLSMAADQLGIKQKSLIDQLMENQEILNRVAHEGREYTANCNERVHKTYVISRNSLVALKNIAGEYKISRDLLVELSINRLRPVITAEQEKQRKWKIIQGEIGDLLSHGQQTLVEAAGLLGEEDHVYRRLAGLITLLARGCNDINQLIEKSERREEFK